MINCLIGTYTKKNSKGIYKLTLDNKGNVLENSLVKEIKNPTYLTKSNDTIFSIIKEEDKGGITSLDSKKDFATISNSLDLGNPPCHIELNSDDSRILSANYHLGTINLHSIKDGEIKVLDSIKHTGSGPHERQEKAHPHFATFTHDDFVLVCDLGTDSVTSYKLNEDSLELAHEFKTLPGDGPRHLAFHPNGKFLYILTELSSTIIVCEYENGKINELVRISTLSESFIGDNLGSAIRITSNEFLYLSNRGENSIVVYKISEDGYLVRVQRISTEGKDPRDFNINSEENILVAGNQSSDNISIFNIDKETGKLSLFKKDIEIPEPVALLFV